MQVTNEMRELVLREIVSPTNARMAATEAAISPAHTHLSGWNTMVFGLRQYALERSVAWDTVVLAAGSRDEAEAAAAEWGCDHCRNDGKLENGRCPKCDAEFPDGNDE